MRADESGMRIPLQVGSELRIKPNGEIAVSNPEVELADEEGAADAVLSHRFDAASREHVLWLLEPVADHAHLRVHREND
jgi:hypothetical protein